MERYRPGGRCGQASSGLKEVALCCLLSLCCPHLASCPSRCERKESGGRESRKGVTARSWEPRILPFTVDEERGSKEVGSYILTLRTSAMPTSVS